MATPTFETPTNSVSPNQQPFFKRLLKKMLWGLVIFLGLIILTSVVIAAFFEDAISKRLVKEINNYLVAELTVEEFDLSLLSSFPNVSANLRKVALSDTQDGQLLEADNLSFRFGLLSLFGSSINVKSVVIQEGALYIFTDKHGKVNYSILKTSESSDEEESSSDFSISLEQASLDEIEVIFIDRQSKQEARVFLDYANFSGKFSSNQFSLVSDARIESDFIELDGSRFFTGKLLGYDATIDVDLEKGNFAFSDVQLKVESNVFQVDGLVKMAEKGTQFDLEITNDDGNLESIIQLLPNEYLDYIGDFSSSGIFLFNTKLQGLLSEKTQPSIQVNFGLRDGKIKSPRLDKSLKDVSFSAWFSNGKYKNNVSTVFEISDFKGYFNRELTELSLKVENLDDPRIDFKLDGTIPLSAVHGLLNMPSITDGDGEIEFKNISINGRYEDMMSMNRISRVAVAGEMEFDDAALTINKEEMIIDKGTFELKGNDLTVNNVKIEGADSEILLSGDFYNIIPVLFADSLNSKNAELEFKASLKAPKLDIDQLLALTEIQVEEEDVEAEVYDSLLVEQTQDRKAFTDFLNGTFEADIKAFNFNKIEGNEFIGKLAFDNNEMRLDGAVEIMEGKIDLDGKAYFDDKPRVKVKMICQDIDANQFFYQTENFGQEVLTSKNLKGRLSAYMSINVSFDEEGAFLADKLRVLGGLSIKNGELLRFKMLEDFSSVINIKDLRHIKFQDVQNWFEIRKGKLYLPVMFVQSNALNLTLSGAHSFDQDIDYNIKVNVGQILAKKFKRHDSKLRPQAAKKNGWFNLYYNIVGPLEDFKLNSSKSVVQKSFLRSDHRRKEIANLLQKEFGQINLLDREPEAWRDVAPIPEYNEEEEEEVFLDEMGSNSGE